MNNGETSKEAIRFVINVARVSGSGLIKGIKIYMRNHEKRHNAPKEGKQTVKELIKQGQGASSMEVSGESIGTFKKIANKYGVDFAIVKDKTADPPRYMCFFKAKDMDAITAVVKEYSAEIVKRRQKKEKPSLVQQLRKLKEEISKKPRKEKTRYKEKVR